MRTNTASCPSPACGESPSEVPAPLRKAVPGAVTNAPTSLKKPVRLVGGMKGAAETTVFVVALPPLRSRRVSVLRSQRRRLPVSQKRRMFPEASVRRAPNGTYLRVGSPDLWRANPW